MLHMFFFFLPFHFSLFSCTEIGKTFNTLSRQTISIPRVCCDLSLVKGDYFFFYTYMHSFVGFYTFQRIPVRAFFPLRIGVVNFFFLSFYSGVQRLDRTIVIVRILSPCFSTTFRVRTNWFENFLSLSISVLFLFSHAKKWMDEFEDFYKKYTEEKKPISEIEIICRKSSVFLTIYASPI